MMKQHSRRIEKGQRFVIDELAQKFSGNRVIRELLTKEKMRQGYESMAQINLDICEHGIVDCLSALHIFEDQLNGDD